jgi:hypothetical protein
MCFEIAQISFKAAPKKGGFFDDIRERKRAEV